MHWAAPKKETMLEGSDLPPQQTQESDYVILKGQHEPGDLGFLRTGTSPCGLFLRPLCPNL